MFEDFLSWIPFNLSWSVELKNDGFFWIFSRKGSKITFDNMKVIQRVDSSLIKISGYPDLLASCFKSWWSRPNNLSKSAESVSNGTVIGKLPFLFF